MGRGSHVLGGSLEIPKSTLRILKKGDMGPGVSFRFLSTLRMLGMSWGVKTTYFEAPGVSLGGSGVSIGGVRILRV